MMSFVLQFVADMDWYAASIYLFHFIEQSHSFRQLKKTHKWKTVHTQKKKQLICFPGAVCGVVWLDLTDSCVVSGCISKQVHQIVHTRLPWAIFLLREHFGLSYFYQHGKCMWG